MKLNQDCVRDILLATEELPYNHYFKLDYLVNAPEFKCYTSEEIQYSVEKLKEAGYIDAEITKYLDGGYNFALKSITWSGHEFLDNIRNKDT